MNEIGKLRRINIELENRCNEYSKNIEKYFIYYLKIKKYNL